MSHGYGGTKVSCQSCDRDCTAETARYFVTYTATVDTRGKLVDNKIDEGKILCPECAAAHEVLMHAKNGSHISSKHHEIIQALNALAWALEKK